jgi:hypothetical protein
MGPDSSNQPTPPDLPAIPSAQPVWPTPQGNRPPSSQPPWALFAIIGTVVIVALVLGLLLLLRAGTTPSTVVPPTSQTNTVGSGTPSPAASPSPTATAQATPTATTPAQPPAVQLVVNQATVSSGTPVEVSCPSGQVALSGGWATNGTAPAYNSTRDGNGWRIFPQGTSVLTNAYVMCLQNDPGASVTERSQHLSVNANSTGTLIVPCNPGEVAVGGGFANPSAPDVEIYNFTYMGSGWGGYAANHTGSAQVVTFYTECLTAPGAQVTFTSPASTTLAPGASGGTQVSCPGGTLLSGGGFVDDENAIVYNSSPNSGSTWGADLTNQGSSGNLLEVSAMCLSLG